MTFARRRKYKLGLVDELVKSPEGGLGGWGRLLTTRKQLTTDYKWRIVANLATILLLCDE